MTKSVDAPKQAGVLAKETIMAIMCNYGTNLDNLE